MATGTQKLLVTQSGGTRRREVGWCQSSALLVRRSAAEQVGYLDPDFFVYSDETDFCKRLRDAGWRILFEPAAVATHHNQLSNDRAAEARRLAEFHRNRDLYMRKHHSSAERLLTRALWVVAYLERASWAAAGGCCATPATSWSQGTATASARPPRRATRAQVPEKRSGA